MVFDNQISSRLQEVEEEEEEEEEENNEGEDDDEDFDDPDYRFFLDHLTLNAGGNSYILHIDPSIHVRYEEEEAEEDEDEDDVFNNKKKKKKKKVEKDDELEKKKTKKKTKKEIKKKIMKKKKEINFDPLDPYLDRDYADFLRCLKLQRDGSLLLHLDNNVNICYTEQHEEEEDEAEKSTPTEFVKEEEEEEYDDVNKEVLIKIEEEDDEDQKEIPTKIDSDSDSDSDQESYSPPPPPPPPPQTWNASGKLTLRQEVAAGLVCPFQTRLLKRINRPYDQREYHKLLKSATARKPVVKYKHLKTRDVPYQTNILGSSYFDHYPDLHERFKSADRCQRLVLLRGFFFWLKNLGHQGAYKPWISTP